MYFIKQKSLIILFDKVQKTIRRIPDASGEIIYKLSL